MISSKIGSFPNCEATRGLFMPSSLTMVARVSYLLELTVRFVFGVNDKRKIQQSNKKETKTMNLSPLSLSFVLVCVINKERIPFPSIRKSLLVQNKNKKQKNCERENELAAGPTNYQSL
jgi:hypothetical protein